uniref:HMG box domain-containing protein n=1 Tax=Megaselia scalaris TaxID=36166 RepID=T1GRA8_MEGSC
MDLSVNGRNNYKNSNNLNLDLENNEVSLILKQIQNAGQLDVLDRLKQLQSLMPLFSLLPQETTQFQTENFTVREEIPDEPLNLSKPKKESSIISKQLGSKWKELTDEEKRPFYEQQHRLSQSLLEQHPDYRYKPRRKRVAMVNGQRVKIGDWKKIMKYQQQPYDQVFSRITPLKVTERASVARTLQVSGLEITGLGYRRNHCDVYYIYVPKNRELGVGFSLWGKARNAVIRWETVNERLCWIQLNDRSL